MIFDEYLVDMPSVKVGREVEFREMALSHIIFRIEDKWSNFQTLKQTWEAFDENSRDPVSNHIRIVSPLPYNNIALCFDNCVILINSWNYENGWPAIVTASINLSFLKGAPTSGIVDGENLLSLAVIKGKYRNWSHNLSSAVKYSEDGDLLGTVDRNHIGFGKLIGNAAFAEIEVEHPTEAEEIRSNQFLALHQHEMLNRFLTFLSCINIRVIDCIPSAKEQRSRKAAGLRPLVQFKTLQLKSKMTSGGGGDKGLWTNRVHLCRGHFSTYTEDAPLFGKYVGRYWIPPHVRGDRSSGIVQKDYVVTDK